MKNKFIILGVLLIELAFAVLRPEVSRDFFGLLGFFLLPMFIYYAFLLNSKEKKNESR